MRCQGHRNLERHFLDCVSQLLPQSLPLLLPLNEFGRVKIYSWLIGSHENNNLSWLLCIGENQHFMKKDASFQVAQPQPLQKRVICCCMIYLICHISRVSFNLWQLSLKKMSWLFAVAFEMVPFDIFKAYRFTVISNSFFMRHLYFGQIFSTCNSHIKVLVPPVVSKNHNVICHLMELNNYTMTDAGFFRLIMIWILIVLDKVPLNVSNNWYQKYVGWRRFYILQMNLYWPVYLSGSTKNGLGWRNWRK